MGVAVGTAVSHVASAAPKVLGAVVDGVRALKQSRGAEITADAVVLRSAREALGEGGLPRDRLLNQGTPKERVAAWHAYQAKFPDAPMGEFMVAVERGTASLETTAEQVRLLEREMRREMLAGIPPAERGQHARTPIIVLSDAEFTARTGSEVKGYATTLRINGEPVVVVREGAPLSALREEGKHVRQLRDPVNIERAELLDESRMERWPELSVEERMKSWNAKLDLEIEAQRELVVELDAEIRSGKLSEARVKELGERLDDARDALAVFERRRRQLAGITTDAAEAMSKGELDPPEFLDDPARLFGKKGKKGPPTPKVTEPVEGRYMLEATSDPNVWLGPITHDSESKKFVRYVYEYRWPPVEPGKPQLPPDKVLVGQIRWSGSRKIWVTSGSQARFTGGLAEMASKMEIAARMGTDAHGVKRFQFDAQTARGTGFDDVFFEIRQDPTGQPVARVGVVEVKDYGDGTVYKFTAIDDNIAKNVAEVERRMQALIDAKRWADIGLDEVEARAVLAAVKERRLDIEIRTAPDTKIPSGYEAELERSLRKKKDLWKGVPKGTPRDITVKRGEHVSESSIALAEPYWNDLERMRLGGEEGYTPSDLRQFKELATRPSGITPKSLDEAVALMLARDHPSKLISGPMEIAPGGKHFLDCKGPIAVLQPSRSTTTRFYLPGIAREILDAAERQLPNKGGSGTLPRVVVDMGMLKRYEADLLEVYLRVQAKNRGQQDALRRIVIVGKVPR
jgi:hypothetical protein